MQKMKQQRNGSVVWAAILIVSILLACGAIAWALIYLVDSAAQQVLPPVPARQAAQQLDSRLIAAAKVKMLHTLRAPADAIFTDVLVVETDAAGVSMITGMLDCSGPDGQNTSWRFYIDLKPKGDGFITVGRPEVQQLP